MADEGPLTILKIGGSVITDRRQERPRFRRSRTRRIAAEIAEAWGTGHFRLVLIHGAGSFGHPIARRTRIDGGLREPAQRIAMGETQWLQTWLNAAVVRCLLGAGLPAFPWQASASAVTASRRLVEMDTRVIEGLLDQRMIPVLNGVPAYDLRQGCCILSGDQLAAFLYRRLRADRILHGTNVRGIFASDPSENPEARFLPCVDLGPSASMPSGIGGSAATDVTGGMGAKLAELLDAGAPGQVFDATREGNVQRALAGEVVGTEILCT